jgi:hypothetical protein
MADIFDTGMMDLDAKASFNNGNVRTEWLK